MVPNARGGKDKGGLEEKRGRNGNEKGRGMGEKGKWERIWP